MLAWVAPAALMAMTSVGLRKKNGVPATLASSSNRVPPAESKTRT
jgi:hypothetical protein